MMMNRTMLCAAVALVLAGNVSAKEQAEQPKPPKMIEKATWRESLITSREALLKWETEQDRAALGERQVDLGAWYLLGPLDRKSKTLHELDQATKIDLQSPVKVEGGEPLRWKMCSDFRDGELIDLTGIAGEGKDAVFYLCRDVTLHQDFGKKQFPMGISMSRGILRILPDNQRFGESNVVSPNRRVWTPTLEAGPRQLLIRLEAGRDQQWQCWFALQSPDKEHGPGDNRQRAARRIKLFGQVREAFPAARDRFEMDSEFEAGVWGSAKKDQVDWFPGKSDTVFEPVLIRRLQDSLKAALEAALGPESMAAVVGMQEAAKKKEGLSAEELRGMLYRLGAIEASGKLSASIPPIRLAVQDQQETWGKEYPKAGQRLARVKELEKKAMALEKGVVARGLEAVGDVLAFQEEVAQSKREILLDNPLLSFEKLLIVKGNPSFASNWTGPNRLGQEIQVLSPVRPDGERTTLHKGNVSNMDLHWDAKRLLFSDGSRIWEINTDGSALRRVSAEDASGGHYDACYLPDGRIICVCNGCEQAVPCTGGGGVGNLLLMNPDGTEVRRATVDQDHNWNPTVLHDGRVLYTRWEYTDLPHYFTRLLFHMNPDGTDQKEYYGSNSYWPNAMYWPRPIPGHPSMISCVVSGHHGVSRVGELLLLDPSKGRHEASGAVQRIPGYGKKVEAITADQLVSKVWPRFAAPWPLAEPETNRGAGKYFLVSVQDHDMDTWDLCLVDIFDNITPILEGGYTMPIPLRPRPMPPIIPDKVDPSRKDAVIYVADVYEGPGLQGFPRGTIKKLRIGTHHYRYPGNGDTAASSMEGGWDVKKIMGTVPVNEDGSALFRVPANTPLFVQPLDAEGKSQQIMRSWFTAMPGEVLSCVGCHEDQNSAPPSQYNTAAFAREPSAIEPWHGPVRGFSFDREIQPVLDRRCAGCHNGKDQAVDFRALRLHEGYEGPYSPAYIALQKYVRRPGFEGDYHMPKPAEYEADTSVLVQLLKKGHHNVQLTGEEWERLYTWIDYNVPYPAYWRESHRPPNDDQVVKRAEYKMRYAGITDRDEETMPLPPVATFEAPLKKAVEEVVCPPVNGWPIAVEQATELQNGAGESELEVELAENVKMSFALVPAGAFVMGNPEGFPNETPLAPVKIEQPFYMGRFEVTNQQFKLFDASHDSGVINERWKDRSRRGTDINQPEAAAVRISWEKAMAFCEWLSKETGMKCSLPTEAQWEWACRAGTDTPFNVADTKKAFANIADQTIASWNHGRAEPGYNDGERYTARSNRYPPNAWGLYHMHGNAAEWCSSVYKPYPYNPNDGREKPDAPGPRVVRGGSWNDTLRFATSATRWRYEPYKPVYNVGFRVVMEPPTEAAGKVAAAGE